MARVENHARWRSGMRDETDMERLDRNFDELLQELRVAQTGVQILFAFLLTLPFTPGFADLSDRQRAVFGGTVLATALATAFLVGPVAVHRFTFRSQIKPLVVAVSHAMTLVGLALLLVAVVGSVGVATTAALNDAWAVWLTSISAGVLVACWLVVPLALRVRVSAED